MSTKTITKEKGKKKEYVANSGVVTLQKKELVHIKQKNMKIKVLYYYHFINIYTLKNVPQLETHKEFLAFQEIKFMATNLLL